MQFTAVVPTLFLGVIGQSNMTVTASSTSTANMPLYIDFYLLLDNSPSMGVAATPTDVTKMVNNLRPTSAPSPAHDYNDANNYYNLAKKLGVTTRIDVLRSATQQLMDTAATTATYSNQFRMAIYDFGASSATIGLRALFSLSTSLSSAKDRSRQHRPDGRLRQQRFLHRPTRTPSSARCFRRSARAISAPGPGTSAAPMKYLFFVSDGVADEPNSSCLKPITGSNRCQSPINPALCTAIKNRGIKIAVLYTTYLQLPTNSWYMSWIDPFNKGLFGPSPNSEIAQNMAGLRVAGLLFRGQPDPGHRRCDERAVQEGSRRRADPRADAAIGCSAGAGRTPSLRAKRSAIHPPARLGRMRSLRRSAPRRMTESPRTGSLR